MKKTLLKSMLVAGMLAIGMSAQAQEDVTDQYLKNADLSVDPKVEGNGWTLGDNWRQDYGNATTQGIADSHVNVVEFYAGWGGLDHKAYSMIQKIMLPPGDYRLAVNAFYRQGNEGDGTNKDKAWIFAGEKKQNVAALEKNALASFNGSTDLWKASNAFFLGNFSNEFDFTVETEDSIQVGFQGIFDEARCWVILGPVKLYKYSLQDYVDDFNEKLSEAKTYWDGVKDKPMNAEVKAAMEAALGVSTDFTTSKEVVSAKEALSKAMEEVAISVANYQIAAALLDDAEECGFDEIGQEAYITNETIAAIKAAYDARTLVEVTAEQKAAAAQALTAACKAQENIPVGCNMTPLIVNPTVEGFVNDAFPGWTCEKPAGGNGPSLGGISFEYWAGNASNRDEAAFDYWQEITDLPAGKYAIGAEMFNSLNGEGGAEFNESCGVYGKSGEVEVIALVNKDSDQLAYYETDPVEVVSDASLRIGVKSIARMGARWFVADNFKLIYKGAETTAISEVTTTQQPAAIFNLAGQRVEKAQKGLYIQNGRKFVSK